MAKKMKSSRLSSEKSKSFILNDKTPSTIKEAYKKTVENLIIKLSDNESNAIVVTSCSQAEGKSTNCLNLALTAAENGYSTLIIDADMRKPTLHSLLNIDNKYGLSDILSRKISDISEAINKNMHPNFDVICSGSIPLNPAELISNGMNRLLETLSNRYDYIFIDTPPVSAFSDALIMNNYTAGIVFIIRQGSTRHIEIVKALNDIKITNGRILGFLKVNCKK